MTTAIHVENLSKHYRTHSAERRPAYRTLREVMVRMATAPLRRLRGSRSGHGRSDFWALSDVSFEVPRGEVLGVIGRNGAGKSTLLKIMSRITRPSRGRVSIRGRVGSLLEVGTGFHPELTGRENIFLNGAILGMSRREIHAKFDELVEFSGVEKFLDTPVKYYSSGMYMRLAFAVAAQMEPEVLLVDEVLAVGDGEFQKKCLGKMGDLASAGRTVVFVSHNMAAVRTLCRRAVWLDQGRVALVGDVHDVVNGYVESAERGPSEQSWDSPDVAPGNQRLRLRRVRVVPAGGAQAGGMTVATPIDVEFELWNLQQRTELNLNLVLYNLEGLCIFNSIAPQAVVPPGLFRGRCRIPGNLLNDGVYVIRLLAVQDKLKVVLDLERIVTFEVHDVERPIRWFGKLIGAVRPQLEWTTEPLADDESAR